MPIACIDLIPLFIIEESSNIFQSFSDRAPNSGHLGTLLWIATAATALATKAAFIVQWDAVARSYFSKAFPRQNIANIDRPCCNRNANSVRDHINYYKKDTPTTAIILDENWYRGIQSTELFIQKGTNKAILSIQPIHSS